jgi:hypothetical protein
MYRWKRSDSCANERQCARQGAAAYSRMCFSLPGSGQRMVSTLACWSACSYLFTYVFLSTWLRPEDGEYTSLLVSLQLPVHLCVSLYLAQARAL